MDSSPAGQLPPKSAHTVTTSETSNSTSYSQPSLSHSNSIQENEENFRNRNEMTNSLREHMRKLVHLYKKIVNQAEENRLNYWVALQEIENYKQFTKLATHKSSKKYKEKCDKELCPIYDRQQTIEKPSLPLPHKISASSETRRDQFIVVKKGSSDIKIRLAINTLTKGECACDNTTKNHKKSITKEATTSSDDQNHENFVDVKDSITKRLKEENETLKIEVATLKQQLQTAQLDKRKSGEGEGGVVLPVGRAVSVFVSRGTGEDTINDDTPLQVKVNALLLENQILKEDLDKALEALKNKKEMEPTKEKTSETEKALVNDNFEEEVCNLNFDCAGRLEDTYQQTKVNSKLINEIFWKLEQIQKNMQSIGETLHGRNTQEPLVQRRIVSPLKAVESEKSGRRTDGSLIEEKDSYVQKKIVSSLKAVESEKGGRRRDEGLLEEKDSYVQKRIVSPLKAVESEKSGRSTDGSLLEEKDPCDRHCVNFETNGVRVRCDVATNCISFCVCTSEKVHSSRRSLEATESSFKSPESTQQNLDDDSQHNERRCTIATCPFQNQRNEIVLDDEAASFNEQRSETEIKSIPSARYSQRLQQSNAAIQSSFCPATCNEYHGLNKSDAEVRSGYSARYSKYMKESCSASCNEYFKSNTGTKPSSCSTNCSGYHRK